MRPRRRSRSGRPGSGGTSGRRPPRGTAARRAGGSAGARRRVHPDQVHRVLELVAEAEGPARLVEPAPRPDPLGQRLVLQPVEVAVELRLARSGPGPCPSGSSHQRRVSSSAARAASEIPILAERPPRPWRGRRPGPGPRRPCVSPSRGDVDRGEERGDRPVVAESAARSGSPCSTKYGTGDVAARRRRTGPRFVSTRSAGRRHGDEGRPGAERVPRVLEEDGVRVPVAPDLERARSTPAGRPAPSGSRGRPAAAGPVRRRFRTVSR